MAEWCSITEVEYQLSVSGVTAATNDNQISITADESIVDDAIVNARLLMSQYLVQKYELASITSANEWVKWSTSVFAAVELLRRKGGIVSEGLAQKYSELKEFLTGVQSGILIVPGLSTRSMGGIAMSNLTMDNRYSRAKIRRTHSISFPTTPNPLGTFTDNMDNGTIR